MGELPGASNVEEITTQEESSMLSLHTALQNCSSWLAQKPAAAFAVRVTEMAKVPGILRHFEGRLPRDSALPGIQRLPV